MILGSTTYCAVLLTVLHATLLRPQYTLILVLVIFVNRFLRVFRILDVLTDLEYTQ